jgi:oligopeptide transport system substrate-binding protein
MTDRPTSPPIPLSTTWRGGAEGGGEVASLFQRREGGLRGLGRILLLLALVLLPACTLGVQQTLEAPPTQAAVTGGNAPAPAGPAAATPAPAATATNGTTRPTAIAVTTAARTAAAEAGATRTAATPTRVAGSSAKAGPAGVVRLDGSNPLTLDPAISQDVTSWYYLVEIFSGLIRLDDKVNLVPDIAESWTVSADGRVYTFKLRPNVKFHDGKPVTAQDFKYSLERSLNPRTRSPVAATYLGDIVGAIDRLTGKASDVKGIRVVDPLTLEITIDAPKQYFLSKLTYPTAFVLDQKNVESGARWFEKPNGTGPFKLDVWQKDQRLALARNDAYYGDITRLSRVEYYLGPGSTMGMYETGELDVIDVGAGDVERVTDPRGTLSRDLIRTPQLSMSYIGFNASTPPFDDVNVRQAFAYATDKQRLADVLYKKMVVKAEGILPPGMPGYDPSLKGQEFSPEKAKAALAKSKYGSADKLPEITLTVGERGGSLGESFADMYKRNLGVTINVEEVAQGFYEGLNDRQFQMFFIGWVADYPDPQNFLEILFRSDSDANHGGFSDAEVDKLLDRAGVEQDRDARIKLYRDAERLIVNAVPVIPLYHQTSYGLVKPRVSGLIWTPMGVLSFRGVNTGG